MLAVLNLNCLLEGQQFREAIYLPKNQEVIFFAFPVIFGQKEGQKPLTAFVSLIPSGLMRSVTIRLKDLIINQLKRTNQTTF